MEQSETSVQNPTCFDLVTSDQIRTHLGSIQKNTGLNVLAFPICSVRPGDDIFDWQEIKFRSLMSSDPKISVVVAIREYEKNPDHDHAERLREEAVKEGLLLQGKLPGFARTENDGKIMFFSVHKDDVVPMAQKYARKEGETLSGLTQEEAVRYLEELAEKAIYHEVGHVAFTRYLNEQGIRQWVRFLKQNPDVVSQVILLQKDKYSSVDQIPVPVEAFADFFIDIASGGTITSRLTRQLPNDVSESARLLLKELLRVPQKQTS